MKDQYSGFGNPDLKASLLEKGITRVFVVGLAYDYCVGETAIDSSLAGFETFFVTDATKPVGEET